jgi:antitoxin component YwqK of YwqJK toxin-antitoxin module
VSELGPTKEISHYLNGKIRNEEYYLNGKRHRTDGPAYIDYYENGQAYRETYWLNGETATKEQIEEIKFNKAFDKEVNEILSTNSTP